MFKIDGFGKDWLNFTAIMSKDANQSIPSGRDLQAVYAVADTQYLYIMIKLYGQPDPGNNYIIPLDLTGTGKWDYSFGFNANSVWMYDLRGIHNGQWPDNRQSTPPAIYAVAAVAEIAIPLQIIGNPTNINIADVWIYYRSLGETVDDFGYGATVPFITSSTSTMITTTITNLGTYVTVQMGLGDFTLPIVNSNGFTGKTLTLSDFRGKVIALEFMAPWCPPCQQSASFMENLYDNYASKGVVFIAVAVGWPPCCGDKNVTITQFLSIYHSSLTYVYDSGSIISTVYGISEVPTLFVLSKSGAVMTRLQSGDPIQQHASAAIDAALSQVVVTMTYQTATVSTSQSLQPSQNLTTSAAQTGNRNPIPGFSIGSIMLGLMAGFALLVGRRERFRRKSTS
jgi:thiol-disulfide isomerase/thioredoxin